MRKSRLLLVSLLIGITLLVTALAGCTFGTATTTPTDGTTGGFDWTIIVFVVVLFGIFYFLMIRPQQKRAKEMQKLMESMKVGEEVVTAGGIYGTIERIDDMTMELRIASGATMKVARSSIVGKAHPEQK